MVASGVIPVSYGQKGCDYIRLFELIAMLLNNLYHGKKQCSTSRCYLSCSSDCCVVRTILHVISPHLKQLVCIV